MDSDVFSTAARLRADRTPFVLATVVASYPPQSVRPGAKAIVHTDGTIDGWIGGGCVRPVVMQEAADALADGRPRLVRMNAGAAGSADTADATRHGDVREYPMTCQGEGGIEIYLEPVLASPRLVLLGHTPVVQSLARLGTELGFEVVVGTAAVAPDAFPVGVRVSSDIAGALAGADATTWVVVGTMGAGDEEALGAAAASDAGVASGKAPLVALPAYGCFDLATAAVGAGVRVVLYDLDPATLGPVWPSLEEALSHAPVAIVVAHQYGVPVDVSRVASLAAARGALVVDDAAQGIGASVGGRPVGALGDVGVLSFGRGKGRTGGGGGALLANSTRGATTVVHVRDGVGPASRGLKSAMLLKAQWLFGRPALYWIPASLPMLGLGDTRYHPPHPATAMSDSSAAALARTWDESAREVWARHRAAAAWRRDPRAQGWEFPDSDAGSAVRGELRLAALVPIGERSIDLVARLGGGLMPGYPSSLARLPELQPHLQHLTDYPGAETLTRRLVTLPCHRYVVG